MAGPRYRGWKWSTRDASNPTLVMVCDDTSKAIHMATGADAETDWAVSAGSHPIFYIHSETTPSTDYMLLGNMDGTTAHIGVVGGTTLSLDIAGSAEVTLTASALSPAASNGNALGTATLMWADLFLASGGVINWNNGDVTLTHASNALTVGGGDLLVANTFGVIVGYTAQETVSTGDGSTDLVPEVQILGTAQADASLMLAAFNATDTVAPTLVFVKGGNAAIGSHTVVADNEYVGRIIAFGDDGTDLESPIAEIRFVVNGTPGTGDMPGSIEFYTTADGGETLTKALTLNTGQEAVFAGRIVETMAATAIGTQNHTLTAANILAGVVVHTSVTGAGTVTTDTAANIIADIPLDADGQCIKCYYINKGDQTLTLAGGDSVTIDDAGQTIATNESAVLVFMRASATTVTCYTLGA